MLRGKSSCLGAESATGRPEDLDFGAYSEANAELWSWCFGPLQQQSHAMSVFKNANWTGLTLSMPSSQTWFVFLCTDWGMCAGTFSSLNLQRSFRDCYSKCLRNSGSWQTVQCTTGVGMLQNTMDLLELDLLSDLELHSTCSAFFGGRKSMAAQRTHRELAPTYAAGKVLVPWGRKCHWETGRPWLWGLQRSNRRVVVLVFWSFAAAKSCHERFQERQLNGAHSFHALFPDLVCISLHRLRNVCRHVFEPEFAELLQRLLLRMLAQFGQLTDSTMYNWSRHAAEYHGFVGTWFAFWFGVAFNMQCILWGQEKHGRAANTQGACSHICCGESPRALGQKVPLGDRKTLTLGLTAKQPQSCGPGVLVLCSSKVMPWAFSRTPTERGSLFPCPRLALAVISPLSSDRWLSLSNYQQGWAIPIWYSSPAASRQFSVASLREKRVALGTVSAGHISNEAESRRLHAWW